MSGGSSCQKGPVKGNLAGCDRRKSVVDSLRETELSRKLYSSRPNPRCIFQGLNHPTIVVTEGRERTSIRGLTNYILPQYLN